MKKNGVGAKTIALLGLLLALSQAVLFLASFVPGLEMCLFALSSFLVAAAVMETGIKGGLLFYAASAILSQLLLPNKLMVLPYLFFFGLYPLLKYLIERAGRQWLEVILKLLVFNLCFGAGFLVFREAFLGSAGLPDFPAWVLAVGAQIAFLLYDFLFTLVIGFYKERIHKRMR